MTSLERRFLLFCSLQDKQGYGIKPYAMTIVRQLLNRMKHIIIEHDCEVYEFTKFGEMIYIVYRYENSRFVYQSRLKVDYGRK
jgi:hypothetical protein